MKRFIPVILLALALGGCTSNMVAKIQTASANYQAVVVSINADIAASAPLVAKGCGDLQTVAMLIAPYLPTSGKASQYLGAANGALQGYCTLIPTDLKSTLAAVTATYARARAGYDQVKAGG